MTNAELRELSVRLPVLVNVNLSLGLFDYFNRLGHLPAVRHLEQQTAAPAANPAINRLGLQQPSLTAIRTPSYNMHRHNHRKRIITKIVICLTIGQKMSAG